MSLRVLSRLICRVGQAFSSEDFSDCADVEPLAEHNNKIKCKVLRLPSAIAGAQLRNSLPPDIITRNTL